MSEKKEEFKSTRSMQPKTHKLTVTAMLSAVAIVLMFLEFPLPFLVPPFIKLDFSELPALLAAFSLGPVSGIVVCLVKNVVLALTHTTSSGVGELCNFLLGTCFVLPAGLVYQKMKSRKGALIGSVVGAVIMALMSLPVNFFITYPFYLKIYSISSEQMVSTYQAIFSGVHNLFDCLLIFNVPFTLLKGLLDVAITFLIYKKLSPVLHK